MTPNQSCHLVYTVLCVYRKRAPHLSGQITKTFPFPIAPQPLFTSSFGHLNAGQKCTILHCDPPEFQGTHAKFSPNLLTLMAAQGLPTGCSSTSVQRGSQCPLLASTHCSDFLRTSPPLHLLGQQFLHRGLWSPGGSSRPCEGIHKVKITFIIKHYLPFSL